jgi:hypothetical protein
MGSAINDLTSNHFTALQSPFGAESPAAGPHRGYYDEGSEPNPKFSGALLGEMAA